MKLSTSRLRVAAAGGLLMGVFLTATYVQGQSAPTIDPSKVVVAKPGGSSTQQIPRRKLGPLVPPLTRSQQGAVFKAIGNALLVPNLNLEPDLNAEFTVTAANPWVTGRGGFYYLHTGIILEPGKQAISLWGNGTIQLSFMTIPSKLYLLDCAIYDHGNKYEPWSVMLSKKGTSSLMDVGQYPVQAGHLLVPFVADETRMSIALFGNGFIDFQSCRLTPQR